MMGAWTGNGAVEMEGGNKFKDCGDSGTKI